MMPMISSPSWNRSEYVTTVSPPFREEQPTILLARSIIPYPPFFVNLHAQPTQAAFFYRINSYSLTVMEYAMSPVLVSDQLKSSTSTAMLTISRSPLV